MSHPRIRGTVRAALVCLGLSILITGTAFVFRQEPRRTATDAYLPMRALSAGEAAALLLAETVRDPDQCAATIVEHVSDTRVVILTRMYAVPRTDPDSAVPESGDRMVAVAGRRYDLLANSWENYVCRYKVPREPLERILGHAVSPSSPEDAEESGIPSAPVSFSSDRIALYFAVEVLMVAAILFFLFGIFFRTPILAWLPLLCVLTIMVLFAVIFYSPAFFDADFFHQRIVVEDLWLLLFIPFVALGSIGVLLAFASGLAGILVLIGRFVTKKRPVAAPWYRAAVVAVSALAVTVFVIMEVIRYRRDAARAGALIAAVLPRCEPDRVRTFVGDLREAGFPTGERFLKNERLPEDIRVVARDILSARIPGDPDLYVFIPIEDRIAFLWANESFTYADIRERRSVINDPRIQPAFEAARSRRTGFTHYVWSGIQGKRDRLVRVEIVMNDTGEIAAAILAESR